MTEIENLKELLNDYRNSIKSDLNDEELKDIDKYIGKVINEMTPLFEMTAVIAKDKEQLKIMKEYLDNTIKEEKWLEKLLKTS